LGFVAPFLFHTEWPLLKSGLVPFAGSSASSAKKSDPANGRDGSAAAVTDSAIGQARRTILVQAWPILVSHDQRQQNDDQCADNQQETLVVHCRLSGVA
jgi:hypothetical protein